MNIEIKNRWTGAVVFSGDYENLKAAVLAAVAASADLRHANLRHANLSDANLSAAENTWDPAYSLKITPDPTLARKVAEAATKEGALDMGQWHHSCGTTHCLAGWAVHLSGPAGYALEKMTSPSVAGSILLPEASHLFFQGNDEAQAWCKSILAHEDPSLPIPQSGTNSPQG